MHWRPRQTPGKLESRLDLYQLRKQPMADKVERRLYGPPATIAAAFICTDGITIGADIEHSSGSKY